MSMLDFMTSGAPLPAGTTPSSMTTTSSLPDWYNNYAANLLSPQPMQQPQQPQQQGGQAQQQQYQQQYQQPYQQQPYQQQPYQQQPYQQQQGGQAQQQPYSPYATPEWERAALLGLSQSYPQAPTQRPFAVPQPMPQQPMSQQPMSQQPMSQQQMSQLQLPGYPTQPDVIPYNNGGSMQPKPMYTPLPYVPNPSVPELMPDPTLPQSPGSTQPMYTPMDNLKHLDGTPYGPLPPPSPFQSTVGAYNMYPKLANTVNPYNSPMYPKPLPPGPTPLQPMPGPMYPKPLPPGPTPRPGPMYPKPRPPGPTPLQPMPSNLGNTLTANNPVAMARGGLFAVNRPAPRVSSMAVKQGRI
jgi:hypothetical protein